MFDKSINEIHLSISKLKEDNKEEAVTHISKMEAYLPIGRYEGLNSICSSYCTVVQQYCDEDYKIQGDREEFKDKLISLGEKIKTRMEGDNFNERLRTEISDLKTKTVYTGHVEKIDENSPIGEAIRTYLKD